MVLVSPRIYGEGAARMHSGRQVSCWVLITTLCTALAQVQFPILQIPARQALPALQTSRDYILLNMVPNEIRVSRSPHTDGSSRQHS